MCRRELELSARGRSRCSSGWSRPGLPWASWTGRLPRAAPTLVPAGGGRGAPAALGGAAARGRRGGDGGAARGLSLRAEPGASAGGARGGPPRREPAAAREVEKPDGPVGSRTGGPLRRRPVHAGSPPRRRRGPTAERGAAPIAPELQEGQIRRSRLPGPPAVGEPGVTGRTPAPRAASPPGADRSTPYRAKPEGQDGGRAERGTDGTAPSRPRPRAEQKRPSKPQCGLDATAPLYRRPFCRG